MKKTTMIKSFALLVVFSIFSQTALPIFAQSAAAPSVAGNSTNISAVNDKIRAEAMNNSQIMRSLHFLSDVYGPRLTGSPNHKAAADWAVKQMQTWGFDDAHLEAWDFGNPGWVNERAAGFITAPVQDSLVFEVLAWTPGTKGAVSGQAFQMILPVRPTQTELTQYFESVKNNVRGKMILVGRPAVIPVNFEPAQKRISDENLRRRLEPSASPNPLPAPTPSPSPAPTANTPPITVEIVPTPTPKPGQLPGAQIAEQVDKFLLDSGALVRINDAGREHGQIRAFNNRSFDATKVVPTVVMRNEDFGRIARLLADQTAVSLEFDIRSRTISEGATSYNVIGEIAGTDKKDEVIMLGGHLDSWHAATGATDNAIGCAIMLEAARIIKTSGIKPRRTVRVALWSGEEQGLLGSQAYVEKHFGSFENPKPAYAKFGGYFNIDSGTGRARAMSVFGPSAAADILRDAVAPFAEYGILGAAGGRSRELGGSDHTSFNQAGLPGIGVLQDPIEYGSHTWHTNLDTYERIVEDDVKKSAAVIAAAVMQLAMRDELLPRFKSGEMPKAPAPEDAPTKTIAPTPAPRN